LPSVTTLPDTPCVAGSEAAAGVGPSLKVMTWPSTFRVEPDEMNDDSVAALVVRVAETVTLPAPLEVVSLSALRMSALPVTLRSEPVVLFSTSAPLPLTEEAVWPALRVRVPATLLCTPLARSTAVSTSPTEALVVEPR